jgi:hypothetical protein
VLGLTPGLTRGKHPLLSASGIMNVVELFGYSQSPA